MTRQEQLNEAWCKYRGKCSTEIMQALAFALRWCDEHPNWISVEDELPKDGQYTATINKAGEQDVRHYSYGKWYSNFGNEYDDITHWMPLPKIPKKGGEQ